MRKFLISLSIIVLMVACTEFRGQLVVNEPLTAKTDKTRKDSRGNKVPVVVTLQPGIYVTKLRFKNKEKILRKSFKSRRKSEGMDQNAFSPRLTLNMDRFCC